MRPYRRLVGNFLPRPVGDVPPRVPHVFAPLALFCKEGAPGTGAGVFKSMVGLGDGRPYMACGKPRSCGDLANGILHGRSVRFNGRQIAAPTWLIGNFCTSEKKGRPYGRP